jgi:hypothetical protein|tara:strand:- start:1117 stop:1461 length:345 start_codon:yes stop_codon:yes gene_type:complete
MSNFASGKKAIAYCDRCSFEYPYNDLRFEIFNQKRTGYRVCDECLDVDQPQLQLGKYATDDPQALLNPRPDRGLTESRRFSAFDPIGGGVTEFGSSTLGLDMFGKIGKLTVTTS